MSYRNQSRTDLSPKFLWFSPQVYESFMLAKTQIPPSVKSMWRDRNMPYLRYHNCCVDHSNHNWKWVFYVWGRMKVSNCQFEEIRPGKFSMTAPPRPRVCLISIGQLETKDQFTSGRKSLSKFTSYFPHWQTVFLW